MAGRGSTRAGRAHLRSVRARVLRRREQAGDRTGTGALARTGARPRRGARAPAVGGARSAVRSFASTAGVSRTRFLASGWSPRPVTYRRRMRGRTGPGRAVPRLASPPSRGWSRSPSRVGATPERGRKGPKTAIQARHASRGNPHPAPARIRVHVDGLGAATDGKQATSTPFATPPPTLRPAEGPPGHPRAESSPLAVDFRPSLKHIARGSLWCP